MAYEKAVTMTELSPPPPSAHAVYGAPSAELDLDLADARQVSPFVPGADALDELATGSLDRLTLLAPPGSIERRAVLAHGLRALRPGGTLLALAPKDKGGARLADELTALGAPPAESYRRRHRICVLERPPGALPLEAAIAEGAPRFLSELGLFSQPGIFSWDRIDPGSALLLQHLPALSGHGADLGSGLGVLTRALIAMPAVASVRGVELDRRAVACARRNVTDPRAGFDWADACRLELSGLDFVVSNPPFHAEGIESRSLGQDFIRAARRALRKGGRFWLVANRHLPYEATLSDAFRSVNTVADSGGYKVLEAIA